MRGQLLLSPQLIVGKTHGGDLGQGKRKIARPIATKRPMHIVLRSSIARGNWSLLKPTHARLVERCAAELGKRNGVKIYRIGNSGNHLHLLVQARDRKGFQSFLRVFAGRIAQRITRARKGHAFGRRFWDLLAFSRIVEWGQDFTRVKRYLLMNGFEASGLIPYQWRGTRPDTGPPVDFRRGFIDAPRSARTSLTLAKALKWHSR